MFSITVVVFLVVGQIQRSPLHTLTTRWESLYIHISLCSQWNLLWNLLWIYSGCVCQRSAGVASGSGGGVERVRREAQLAALRYEEERQKTRSVQRDTVMNYVKVHTLIHTIIKISQMKCCKLFKLEKVARAWL